MKTVKPIIHWEELFNQNGIPHPHFQSVIDENKTPLIGHSELQTSLSKKEKSVLFWNQEIPDRVHKPTITIHKTLKAKARKINGSINDYTFAAVQLPDKNSDVILKKLQFYFNREKRRDPFGEWLWQQVQQRKYDAPYLSKMITNIKFNLMYTRDPSTGGIQRIGKPADHDDGGIYFVNENALHVPFSETVYVGKSLKSMGTTLWCHFNEWGKKYDGDRKRGSRGEDRGRWIEKIQNEGYTYSVGIIKVLPAVEGFPGVNDQQIRILERLFIHLLNPRDNKVDKIVPQNEAQTSLFETLKDVHDQQLPPVDPNDGDMSF
jgi:hypothetical protein